MRHVSRRNASPQPVFYGHYSSGWSVQGSDTLATVECVISNSKDRAIVDFLVEHAGDNIPSHTIS